MSEKKLNWRRRLKKFLVWLAARTVPFIYFTYFRFVWATSKVTDQSHRLIEALEKPPNKFIAATWHQDVFFVPWVYRRPHVHTIASVGDSGEVITSLLKRSNYTVFRGGSSKRESRRKKILEEFTQYLRGVEKPGVGVTVDGSSGPAYRMKSGVIVMAMKIDSPIYLCRIWCKRRILLNTWDRTLIPLPFNRINIFTEGPYFLPKHMDQQDVFTTFHRFIEDQLLNITYKSFTMLDDPIDEELMSRFPSGWTNI